MCYKFIIINNNSYNILVILIIDYYKCITHLYISK